jgi:3-dehydroquinate synthetase
MDKKVVDGRIRLVLTDAIGTAALTDQAPEGAIRETLEAGDVLCAE